MVSSCVPPVSKPKKKFEKQSELIRLASARLGSAWPISSQLDSGSFVSLLVVSRVVIVSYLGPWTFLFSCSGLGSCSLVLLG